MHYIACNIFQLILLVGDCGFAAQVSSKLSGIRIFGRCILSFYLSYRLCWRMVLFLFLAALVWCFFWHFECFGSLEIDGWLCSGFQIVERESDPEFWVVCWREGWDICGARLVNLFGFFNETGWASVNGIVVVYYWCFESCFVFENGLGFFNWISRGLGFLLFQTPLLGYN